MTRKRITAFLLILSASLVLSVYVRYSKTKYDVVRVKSMIDQNISIGDNSNKVLIFLKKNRATYSQSVVRGQGKSTITSIFKSNTSYLAVKSDVQVVFDFDMRDKMSNYHVKEVYTGP